MALDFITSGYVLSFFLIILGIIHFWAASHARLAGKEVNPSRRSLTRVVSLKTTLLLFGAFYTGLGFLFIFTTYGNSLFLTYEAPCENVINSTDASGGITTYTYVDSCAGKTIPNTVERMYSVLGWSWVIQLILVSLAVLIGIAGWISRW